MVFVDNTLNARKIDGYKHSGGKFRFILLLLVSYIIVGVFGILSGFFSMSDYFFTISMMSVYFSPAILYDVLLTFKIVGISCILTDEGIYFFGAVSEINGDYASPSKGFVSYDVIKDVTKTGKRVVIQGKNFNITIKTTGELADKIALKIKTLKVYDRNGVSYKHYDNIVFYDKSGRSYRIKDRDKILDENGVLYDRNFCFVCKEGYFHYLKEGIDFVGNTDGSFVEYYTDGKELYVCLWQTVYWDAEGNIYRHDNSGTYRLFN